MTTAGGYGWATDESHTHTYTRSPYLSVLDAAQPHANTDKGDNRIQRGAWLNGARGATLWEMFKDVNTAYCQCAWYCGSTTTARSNSPCFCCHSGCGPYKEPIHAPKPQSAANGMTAEADLWLHSHTWFHYALVKTAPSTTNAAVQVFCLFGRGCGWKDGEGREEGKKIGYEKAALLRERVAQGRIWEIAWTGHFAWY